MDVGYDWLGSLFGGGSSLSGFSDWLANYANSAGSVLNKNMSVDDYSNTGGGLLDTLTQGAADYADSIYNFSPNDSISSMTFAPGEPSGGNWTDTIFNKSNTLPLTALGGVLSSGASSILQNKENRKKANAASQGSQNYMNALQSGRKEATSQFLQNLAAQKTALANKLGSNYSESGGATNRGNKKMQQLQRQGNEAFGNFQLNLAQEKTPDLSAFTQAAASNATPSDSSAFWKGLTSGFGQTAGNIGSIYASNLLKSLFA